MNLTYTRPGELRKPDIEVLPDGRLRITRYIAAGIGDRDYSEVTENVGTTDLGLNTALLVKRGMARIEGKDAIVKTYEVRNPLTETPVGREDVQFGENGLKTVIADFVQMSSGTYTPQTVGVTPATYDSNCILRNEVMEDDGTTRQIRRFYINKGLLLETNETKNNGALFLKTLVYLNDASSPNPPTGYTLVSQKNENPAGLPTYTYVYAKGTGQIGEDDEVKNNGALLLRTIRYISTPSVTSNPISTPTGYTNFAYNYTDQDGYRIWSASYAKGVGQISQDDEVKNNGALLIRNIRYISTPSVSTNPITTPTGYTNVSYSYVDQDGYRIWTASYAKGNGQVSKSDETRLSGMLLRSTIVWLTDSSVTTQPTTDPLSGGTIVSQEYADRDGHRVWTVVWVKGVTSNDIIVSKEYKNNGNLVVTKKQKLNLAPSSPSAEIGGTVVLIDQSTQSSDGYTLYSATWAEGYGTISESKTYQHKGRLVIYRATSLAVDATTPSPSIGGTVVTIETSSRKSDGVTIYDHTWAEGVGLISYNYQIRVSAALVSHTATSLESAPSAPSPVIGGTLTNTGIRSRYENGVTILDYEWVESVAGTSAIDVRTREDGSTVYTVTVISPTQSTPAYPGAGTAYLVDTSYERSNGYYTNRAVYITLPTDYNYPKQVSFTVPGLIIAANPPIIKPPINRNLMATAYVTHTLTPATDVPYSIVNCASLSISYKRKDNNLQDGKVTAYDGYVGSSSYVGSNVTFMGVDVYTVAVTVSGANPTTQPSGLTVLGVSCEKYLTATDGTTVWRNVVIKYTF